MSTETTAPDARAKALVIGFLIILAAAVLLVYSPSLSQPPMFDEHYLLNWLKHCLQSGLTSSDTTAYLLSSPPDPRDGQTLLGALKLLGLAMVTGTSYSTMRFCQVIVHLVNSVMLFASVYLAILTGVTPNSEFEESADSDTRQNKIRKFHPGAFALAAASALFFGIFPLAPETVGCLYSYPIELATMCSLIATGLLLLQQWKAGKQKTIMIVAAAVLGAVAPWLSFTAALSVGLPFILLLVANGPKKLFDSSFGNKQMIVVVIIAIASALPLANRNAYEEPEFIERLRIEKISATGGVEARDYSPLANMEALVLPVNRNIDEKYNKVLRGFYIFLPLPLILLLAAALTNPVFRMTALGTTAYVIAACFATTGVIDGQNFYGARWLYGLLPGAAIFWALLATSPIFIETGKRATSTGETIERLTKVIVCAVLIIAASALFAQRTYRQSLSYKSNGKLWKVIAESISTTGQQKTSPFLIVRNLPQSLAVEPVLSPFSPQLIDSKTGLARTGSLSGGRLKDALRNGKYQDVTLHFEKQFEGFLGTDVKIVDAPFGPVLNAEGIAAKLKPPLMYYNGAIKLDESKENLLMESTARAGPAIPLECYGLSPVDGDFLFVEAKVDMPGANAKFAPLELHWLTNWRGDYEARDRKVVIRGMVGDGQYHRYLFPLRTLAWTTSGLPSNIMLGFPRGSKIAVRSLGLCREPIPLPEFSVSAVHRQDGNRTYFSHYCFNYPDLDELGLCAVYGKDNGLDIKYDVSKIEGAKGILVEMQNGNEVFRNENSDNAFSGYSDTRCDSFTNSGTTGDLKIASEKLRDGISSVRVFATGADNKVIGHSSDSLKILVDKRL